MTEKIISNYTSLKGHPNAFRFSVVFIDCYSNKEEFIFISNSLSQCITQCTSLINYLFRYSGYYLVYIFPTNNRTTYRNVYARQDGYTGEYKMIRCKDDAELTLEEVKAQFLYD